MKTVLESTRNPYYKRCRQVIPRDILHGEKPAVIALDKSRGAIPHPRRTSSRRGNASAPATRRSFSVAESVRIRTAAPNLLKSRDSANISFLVESLRASFTARGPGVKTIAVVPRRRAERENGMCRARVGQHQAPNAVQKLETSVRFARRTIHFPSFALQKRSNTSRPRVLRGFVLRHVLLHPGDCDAATRKRRVAPQ